MQRTLLFMGARRALCAPCVCAQGKCRACVAHHVSCAWACVSLRLTFPCCEASTVGPGGWRGVAAGACVATSRGGVGLRPRLM